MRRADHVRRVSVVGTSGSGKSTIARRVAEVLDVPHVELDGLRHQAGWRELPDDVFAERVAAAAAKDGWVIDGNYSVVREAHVWPRADTVIWLDLPRATVLRRIVWRSLRRVVRREELWNGNRESWRDLLAWDPQRSVIRWSWTTHAANRRRYRAAAVDPTWVALRFIRIRRRRDVTLLIERLTRSRSDPPPDMRR